MAQDLQDLLDEARGLMNDVDADLITDRELKKWLNEGLVHLTLQAQMLEDVYQFTTGQNSAGMWLNEYPLPTDSGEIKNVWAYNNGRQHELTETKMAKAMEGSNQTSSILTHYYKRLNTHAVTTRDTASAIVRSSPGSKALDRYPLYVLGLFPTPTTAQQITVRMNIPHPRLRNARDRVLVPFQFHFGPVAYALFKCYSKEKAYAEARHYSEVWNDILDQAREWQSGQGRDGHGEVVRDFDPIDMTEWPGRAIID